MHKEALAWSENPRHFDDQRAHYQSNLVNTVSEPNTKTAAVLKSNVYSSANLRLFARRSGVHTAAS